MPDEPLYRWYEPVIDAHAHPRGLSGRDEFDRDFVDGLVAYSRSLGVEHMAALGEVLYKRAGYTEAELRLMNDRNAELTAAHPDFFVPFCFLDPLLGGELVREEVKRCHEDYGFRALKLEVCCNVSDSATDSVFEEAARRGFPVLVHASDSTLLDDPTQSDYADVREAARRHPSVSIMAAHLTGGGVRGVLELQDVENVIVDTSGMQPESGIVEYAVDRLGEDRVVFGSDMWGRDLTAQIGQVLAADLPDAVKSKLFRENAERWLGLDG